MSETTISQNHSLGDKSSPTEPAVESNKNFNIKDNGADDMEESSPIKKIKLSNDVIDEPKEVIPTPGRGRPSKDKKRLNILEKTAKEGEALLQNLGHKDADPEGNRRQTRSRTRGTPPAPPTPKKAVPKATPQRDNSSSGAPKRRGRPPKSSITNNNSVEEKTEVNVNSETKTESSELSEGVNNTIETNNNTSNDENPSEQSNSNDWEPSARDEPKESEPKAVEPKANEQTKDLTPNESKTKHNSISVDNSVPVIDTTQQSTTD